jgi:hypothetical protein
MTLARLAILLAIFAVLFFFTPPDFPVCGFRWLTHRPCPFCGLTHAFFALSKGHVAEALHFHALSPLAALWLLALIADRPLPPRSRPFTAAAFALYGLARIL